MPVTYNIVLFIPVIPDTDLGLNVDLHLLMTLTLPDLTHDLEFALKKLLSMHAICLVIHAQKIAETQARLTFACNGTGGKLNLLKKCYTRLQELEGMHMLNL